MSNRADWRLEQAALGECPKGYEPDTEALAALERSNKQILVELPPRVVTAEIHRRMEEHRARKKRRALFTTSTFAAAAAILFFFVFVGRGGHDDQSAVDPGAGGPEESVRIKGSMRLLIHREAASEPALLKQGSTVASGDLLQLSYAAGGKSHGVIVSIDGRGSATLHFPSTPGARTAIAPTETTALAHSYRLDDAPRFERFFFVASQGPIDPAMVLRAAERLASKPTRETALLRLPEQLEQTAVLLRKKESP